MASRSQCGGIFDRRAEARGLGNGGLGLKIYLAMNSAKACPHTP